MRYFGKVKTFGNNIDLSSYGREGFDWDYERAAGRKPNRDLWTMSFEDLFSKAINLHRSFPKKLKKFDEAIICNEGKYFDYGLLQEGIKDGRCLTKMLTVTFAEDIQDKGTAYKEFDRVLKSIEKKIFEHFGLERFGKKNFKITGIGVYERHHENRTGYHVHLIAFNIPKFKPEFYEYLKRYAQDSLRASIKIDVPKQKKFKEGERVDIADPTSMRTYLRKVFNYIKKQFRETLEIVEPGGFIPKPELYNEWERAELRLQLLKVLPDLLDGKTFVKRGKLLKPDEIRFETLQEFEEYRDEVIKGGDYKVKNILVCNNFIPVTFVFLEKVLEKISHRLNELILEFLGRETFKCSLEKWYNWEDGKHYTALAGYILKEE